MTDKELEIIRKTKNLIKGKLYGEGSGHDWWHIHRVWTNARNILKEEKANPFIVELAALLHDIADYKLHDGDEAIGPKLAREWLETNSVDNSVIDQVIEIIETMSFKGLNNEKEMTSIEGKVVRDADRLDAIGAIGIARCFAFGGSKNRAIWDPEAVPNENMTVEEYKSNNTSSINHFYEKLIHLKDLMTTNTGRKIAEERHKFLQQYLKQFHLEWEGKK